MPENEETLADLVFGLSSEDREPHQDSSTPHDLIPNQTTWETPGVPHDDKRQTGEPGGGLDDIFGQPTQPNPAPAQSRSAQPAEWSPPQPPVHEQATNQNYEPAPVEWEASLAHGHPPTRERAPATGRTPAPERPPTREQSPTVESSRHSGSGATLVQVNGVEVYHVQTGDSKTQQRLQDDVEHTISYISADARLGRFTQQLKLTRNQQEDQRQYRQLSDELRVHLGNIPLATGVREVDELIGKVYDELIGLGPLGVPWRDDAVTEILVDAWDKIYVEYDGRLLVTDLRFRNQNHVMSIARNLARIVSDRALSPTNPLVTAQLDGARVNFACAPVVGSGIAISLRKFKPLLGMDALLQYNALTPDMREFLADVVRARATVLVSGGTGVGKTTLINALSEAIPNNERVITIEDSYELKLANRFVVSMQTKEQASRDDDIIIDQQQLLVNTLRMRPDRIVVGEIREGKAAAVMLEAASTGHDGTMTTIHANSVDAAINNRLASLVRMGSNVSDDIAKYQIAEAFDIVVQGTRRRNRRFIEEIAELDPRDYTGDLIKANVIFRGKLDHAGNTTFERVGSLRADGRLAEKFYIAGIDPKRWT